MGKSSVANSLKAFALHSAMGEDFVSFSIFGEREHPQ